MTSIDLDADAHVPAGWSVAEHRKGGQRNFDPKQVELWYAQKQQNDEGIIGTARSAPTLPVGRKNADGEVAPIPVVRLATVGRLKLTRRRLRGCRPLAERLQKVRDAP
jgi:hypothetical protein